MSPHSAVDLQMHEYWTRFKKDAWINKMFVSCALVTDIAGM
jgi:hypothetical protein